MRHAGRNETGDVMSSVLKDLGESRPPRWFAAALTVTAIVLAGCGIGGGDDDGAPGKTTSPSQPSAGGEATPILIKTRMNAPTGRILDGSTIGESPFCPGGTVKDQHGTPGIGLVDRTITCREGTLRMGFDPQAPVGDTQRGSWRIISGTGDCEGWAGSGQMVIRYDQRDASQHPTKGREAFSGTVSY